MSEQTEEVTYVWVPDYNDGKLNMVALGDVEKGGKNYSTPREALAAMRAHMVREIAYNGRDIENATKKVDEMRAKQADDAVVLYNIMVQLGEIHA
jgi:hypothetical protein